MSTTDDYVFQKVCPPPPNTHAHRKKFTPYPLPGRVAFCKDKLTGRLTSRQTHRQFRRQRGRQAGRQSNRQKGTEEFIHAGIYIASFELAEGRLQKLVFIINIVAVFDVVIK